MTDNHRRDNKNYGQHGSARKASEYSEPSRNLWSSTVGVAVRLTTHMAEMTVNTGPHKKVSKDSKDSQNLQELRGNSKTKETKNDLNGDQCEQTLTGASEYSKYLRDSWEEWTSRNSDIQQGSL